MIFRNATSSILFAVVLLAQAPTVLAGGADTLQNIQLEPKSFTLAGRDAWRQLLVTGHHASGQARDWTRKATYAASPAGIVRIDTTGLVTPIKDGKVTITVTAPGTASVNVNVTVTHIADDLPINFANQVVPLFTKFGCNAGGCHGKASGQNGFKLSLLGFEPEEDYEYIVKENRGRRLFPASPAQSMLLTKATGVMPHGGGKRIDIDSPSYRILLRWIEQGTPYGRSSDPVVTRIEVLPAERLLQRGSEQQLAVIAHHSDGSTVDVTRLAQFEANERELASVSPTGLGLDQGQPARCCFVAVDDAGLSRRMRVVVFRAALSSCGLARRSVRCHRLKTSSTSMSAASCASSACRRRRYVTTARSSAASPSISPAGCRRWTRRKHSLPTKVQIATRSWSIACSPAPTMPTSSPASGALSCATAGPTRRTMPGRRLPSTRGFATLSKRMCRSTNSCAAS